MNKKGISLIVLVITIIVMIILAASVVITLSNTGIIDKANSAVNTTNVKEVEQYVQLLWSEAYMEGNKTAEDIQTYIDSKLSQEIKDAYEIVATENGVTVTLPIDPTSITIASAAVTIGKTLDLNDKVTYLPEYSKRKSLTWEIAEGSSYATITEAGVITGVAVGTVTVKATITGTSISNTVIVTIEAAPAVAEATTSYVGYYADVDGDGDVDGVIYADLLAGSSTGTWSSSNTSTYDYTTLADYTALVADSSKAKTYTVSATTETYAFGAKNVIKLASDNTGTIDRFYVMALEDIKATVDGTEQTTFYWYNGAYGNMVSSDTATAFGAGKKNTTDMKAYWDAGVAGSNNTAATKNNRDMWNVIASYIAPTDANAPKWFVPSKDEWSAFAVFAKGVGLTTSNYNSTYGLQNYYWSSSQHATSFSWGTNFNTGYMRSYTVTGTYGVRLSVTF